MQHQPLHVTSIVEKFRTAGGSSLVEIFNGLVYSYLIRPLRIAISTPAHLLNALPRKWVALALVVSCEFGPKDWFGEGVRWNIFGLVIALAVLVLAGNLLDYLIDVLVRVSWRAPLATPLVPTHGEYPRPDLSLATTFMLVGGLSMLPSLVYVVVNLFIFRLPANFLGGPLPGGVSVSNAAVPGVCLLALGVVTYIVGKVQPTWPFTRLSEQETALLRQWNTMKNETAGTAMVDAKPKSTQTQVAQAAPQQQPQASANPDDKDYFVPFEFRRPQKRFADIHGMSDLKDKLLSPAKQILAPRIVQLQGELAPVAPRNGILLHGEPGNGKTVFAEALAGELGVPFLEVTYGPIASKWIGQLPAMLSRTFEMARKNAPCVMFIDEIDSFIKSREASTNNPEAAIVTNVILTELVKTREHQVVVIGATNYISALDAAAIREGRFDYKVEVPCPDEEARIGLLKSGVKRFAAHVPVEMEQLVAVAKRWNGFSVARLNAVCLAVADVHKKHKLTQFGHAEWMLALRSVQGRRGRVPKDTKSLGEMLFDDNTKSALELIASRLNNVQRIEALGGSLPGGVLFYGPPGTGKTAAARAIAKEAGWAFLSVAGPDLIADRDRLAKLFTEAKDLRPTIVFIDEADDILRNRQYSAHSDMVNKLLTIMDGAEEKIKDLIWIAATNNPENVDPALLRAGRFTEKVLFTPPPKAGLDMHINAWVKKADVQLASGVTARSISARLEGQTIANVEGVLMYALNAAIHRSGYADGTVLTAEDIDQAIRVILTGSEFD